MDDIYFDKKKNDIDIPQINIPDIKNTDSRDNINIVIQEVSSEENSDNFAPYHGKSKKNRSAEKEFGYSEVKSKPAKKHRSGFIRKSAAVIAAVFLVSYVLMFFGAAFSGYTKTRLKRNSYVNYFELASSPLVRNILLIGVDGTGNDESLRSDSMILVSLDFLHRKIKLSSFMRDSWLEIPGYKYAKLNAACSHGGPQLLTDTIEYNFNIDINDYVLVDFSMFTDIIDSLGGVDVEVTPAEAKFINRTTRHTVESGENVHLDGAKALVYCRIRKLDSDYMRTYRQRKVIKALVSKAKSTNPLRLFGCVFGVLPKIQTNMSPFKIPFIIYEGGFSALFFGIESTRIPTDSTSWSAMEGTQSVVELNVQANADYLKQFIYSGSAEPIDGQD